MQKKKKEKKMNKCGQRKMTGKERKEMIVPEQMIVGKEADHEYVSLLCSTKVGSSSVSV